MKSIDFINKNYDPINDDSLAKVRFIFSFYEATKTVNPDYYRNGALKMRDKVVSSPEKILKESIEPFVFCENFKDEQENISTLFFGVGKLTKKGNFKKCEPFSLCEAAAFIYFIKRTSRKKEIMNLFFNRSMGDSRRIRKASHILRQDQRKRKTP